MHVQIAVSPSTALQIEHRSWASLFWAPQHAAPPENPSSRAFRASDMRVWPISSFQPLSAGRAFHPFLWLVHVLHEGRVAGFSLGSGSPIELATPLRALLASFFQHDVQSLFSREHALNVDLSHVQFPAMARIIPCDSVAGVLSFSLGFAYLPPTLAIPLANSSLATSDSTSQAQYVGFVSDPNGRGTISLVISCLLTLLLCVWQALHLNVPKPGETLWENLLINILWITIGVYAPELVVFTAWRQWSSAKLLGRIVKEEEAKSDDTPDNNHTAEPHKSTSNYFIEEVSRHRCSLERRYKWTETHSFFASTGGFAFDIDDEYDETGEKTTTFLPAECPRRLTLTARGVALLARCGLLPDIPEEEIKDKSKANTMAKALVVLQASWMLIQVIGRLIDRLPVTLLEVNTVAHV